jgi:hypothetical protein
MEFQLAFLDIPTKMPTLMVPGPMLALDSRKRLGQTAREACGTAADRACLQGATIDHSVELPFYKI